MTDSNNTQPSASKAPSHIAYVRKRDCASTGKVADCRRGGSLTPPIPAVSTPLHCSAASEPFRWLALSFHCIPPLEMSETGGMMRPCHASCRCHEPRQARPLRVVN
jgi:hypothetical protein